jgi:anthranilate/para-aminobenzoate synthase component I
VTVAELDAALAAEQPFDVARVFISYGATAPSAPEPCLLPDVAYTLESPRTDGGDFAIGEWRTTWEPDDYARAIETVRSAIFEGDVYQVNLVQHMRAPFAGDPVGFARSLAHLCPLEPAVLEGDGWAYGNGDLDLALSIRTFAVVDGEIHLWVGGGIVWDSVAADEIEESWVKARPLIAV